MAAAPSAPRHFSARPKAATRGGVPGAAAARSHPCGSAGAPVRTAGACPPTDSWPPPPPPPPPLGGTQEKKWREPPGLKLGQWRAGLQHGQQKQCNSLLGVR